MTIELNEPQAWFHVTQDERDALDPIETQTVWNTSSNQLEMQIGPDWRQYLTYTGTPLEGDVVAWDGGQWRTSSNIDIIGVAGAHRFKTLADSTLAFESRRTWRSLSPDDGRLRPYGDHIYSANTSMRVEIDTAGKVGGLTTTATFRWSNDNGATWEQELVPVTHLNRIHLENGLYVQFFPGDYDVDDRWDFVAIGTASQLYDLKVDTTNSEVWIGNTLKIANDDTFKLYQQPGEGARLQFSTDVFIGAKLSAGTAYQWQISSTNYILQNSLTGVFIKNAAVNTLTLESTGTTPLLLQWDAAATAPATPSADRGGIYAKLVSSKALPYWINEDGVEYPILFDGMSHVATLDLTCTTFNLTATTITLAGTVATAAITPALGTLTLTGVQAINANAITAALTITQSGAGPAIDIVGADKLRFFDSSSATLHVASSATPLLLTGDFDISGGLAVGDGQSVSATALVTVGTAASVAASRTGYVASVSPTLAADLLTVIDYSSTGTIVGTGRSSLTHYAVNIASSYTGGTYGDIYRIRVAAPAAMPSALNNWYGIHLANPGNPGASSGASYGAYLEVPQGANWTTRIGEYILGGAVGDVIFKHETTATNTDVAETKIHQRVTTTDATTTTIATIPVADDTVLAVYVHCWARQTGGSAGTTGHGAVYQVRAGLRATGGAATLIASSVTAVEDNAAWTCTVAASGANAIVTVTGEANKNITWHAAITYSSVAS